MQTTRIIPVLLLLTGIASGPRPVEGPLEPFLGEGAFELQRVFEDERFPCVVVAMDGTVIATWGSSSVRARRSVDGGATWGEVIPIADPGFQGGGTIVDERSGDVLAFVEAGHPPAELSVYRSGDQGATWELREVELRPNSLGHLPSMHMNDSGITLRHGEHAGRLVRPTRYYAGGNDRALWAEHYTNAVFSDDGGRTWQASEPFPEQGTGEATVAELSDGRLYYNSRVHWPEATKNTRRRSAWSSDGGRTWEDWALVDVLPDGRQDRSYGCMGGLVRLPVEGRDILVFSNLDTPNPRRERVTVWASFDGGRSWPVKRLVFDGPSAYSSLTAGRPGTPSEGWIYLQFEGGPGGGCHVARFDLTWVLGGEPTGDGEVPEWLARGAQDWPQFRGPGASGVSASSGLPDTWSDAEHVAWRTEIPGRGWSSPVVQGGRVFVTTAMRDGGEPEPVKKGLYMGGDRPAPTERHRWVVYGLELDSGGIVWEREIHRGVPEHGHHLKGSLASETPVCDGKRLYAYVGNVGLFCFDLEGQPLWSRRWKSVPTRSGWGTAASPALHAGRVYVVNDNEEQSFLVALDAQTGEQVWRVERDEKSNWATPFVWENAERTEIVTPGSGKIRSYGLDGQLLWELGGMSVITIPTPLAAHGLLYVSSGYVGDRRKPVFAIRPGAAGDISLEGEQTSNEFVAWCQKRAGPYNPSPIVYGGHLYVLYDRGLLACFDALTGEEVYGKQRIGPGATAFTSSPWAYDGKLFCLSEDGETYVIRAGPEFELLRTNSLGELCMATPAIVPAGLILRTEAHVLCIR